MGDQNKLDYMRHVKKIVSSSNSPPTLDDYQATNSIDQLLLENKKMCLEYGLDDQLGKEYKNLVNSWNAFKSKDVANHFNMHRENKIISPKLEDVNEPLLPYFSIPKKKTSNTFDAMSKHKTDNNFNSINEDSSKIKTMTSTTDAHTTKRGRSRKDVQICDDNEQLGSGNRSRCRVKHKRGKKVEDLALDDNLSDLSIGEDIQQISSSDIEKIIPPRVEIVDNSILSIQGYAIKKDGTKLDICNTPMTNQLLFTLTINRERVDILTKLLSTAAIKSSKMAKTVAIVVTKRAFYINIISYAKTTGVVVDISPKILALQRCIKIPLQSAIGSIRLACTNLDNFNKCILRANDFKNGIAIDFYVDGIVAKSDWKMDVNKNAQKLSMIRLDSGDGLYGNGPSNISLIPQTCTRDTSHCFKISLSEFRASMGSLKKVIPKGVSELVIGFYAMPSPNEVLILCDLGADIKVPLVANATLVQPNSVNDGFIESITLSTDAFIRMPLLTKTETIDMAFIFLRKNHDYFDFTYHTSLDVEINTRLPIIDFIIGEL